jgi:DNA-directed RNA polymerase specialized sigma24 family protein
MGTEEMEAEVRRQAGRLREQLDEFDSGPAVDAAGPPLAAVGEAAAALRTALASLPPGSRAHLTGAELGFMPGPNLDAFVDRHFQELDKQLSGIAQGARAVREWHGEQGRAARRTFLIRGYIRGFAHQWRQAGRGEPDTGEASPFFDFARHWLDHAGVRDADAKMLKDALGRGWRTDPMLQHQQQGAK